MLQEKKNYSKWCMKLWIALIVILFLIWSWLIVILVFIGFAFFTWNKKTNISFNKLLEFIWVYDCIKYFFWDYEKDDWWYKSTKKSTRNIYLEKINEAIKKRAEELKRKEKREKQKELDKFSKNDLLWDELENWNKNKTRKIERKPIYSKVKKNTKYEHSSFNDWKSIWDDYESVMDIINKKK